MKRINLLIAAIVIGYCNPANAQSVNDDTEITVTNEKGEKETIKTHAESNGESLNSFINRAIHETMERDNKEE